MLSLAESPSSISINIIYSIGNNSVFFHFSSYIWSITAYNTGDMGLIPGLGKSPRGGNDNPFQYSCLEKFHGQRRLESYSPWSCKESDMTEHSGLQFSSITQLCPAVCDPMDCSMPGLPIHHQLPESTQTHVHWVGDAIQLSHPLFPSPPALNLSQHQGLFKWGSSSHQVAKVLEFQLQHQSFQWIFRIDFL